MSASNEIDAFFQAFNHTFALWVGDLESISLKSIGDATSSNGVQEKILSGYLRGIEKQLKFLVDEYRLHYEGSVPNTPGVSEFRQHLVRLNVTTADLLVQANALQVGNETKALLRKFSGITLEKVFGATG